MATCPECDAEIEIDEDDLEEMEIGDPWDCDACGSRLRVANLDPMDFESDEDEDDDEEDKESDEKEADATEEDGDGEFEDDKPDDGDWDE